MDAILQVAHTVATYAPIITQTMGMVVIMFIAFAASVMVDNPDVTMATCLLLALAISWHAFKPIRRFLRWAIIWPIQRMFYRIVRRPVRLLLGGIMARWKYSIIADRLEDTLSKLWLEEHLISRQEYRRLSDLLGKALGLSDLVGRKTCKEGIKHTVLQNIGVMRATPAISVPGPPLKVKVDTSYTPMTNTRNLSYLRRRQQSA